jgi:MEMO1 family protein
MGERKRNPSVVSYLRLLWRLCIILMALESISAFSVLAESQIRKPAVAGHFYPKHADILRHTVDGFMEIGTESKVRGRIIGLMSPHAGYTFSGQVAAYAYREIRGKQYDTVVILGPSHYVRLRGASVGMWDAYETPLGIVPVNKDLAESLLDVGEPFLFSKDAHIREHSIETQLPFLQRVLRDFDIVPLVMGGSASSELRKISEAIANIMKGKNVLLVASSDMSHYPAYRDAMEVDKRTLSVIKAFNPEQVFRSEAQALQSGVENLSTTLCGLGSVVTVMTVAKELGGNAATVLHYANSGDVEYNGHKEKRRVVGYGAVAFYQR